MQKKLGENVLMILTSVDYIANPDKRLFSCFIDAYLIGEYKSFT